MKDNDPIAALRRAMAKFVAGCGQGRMIPPSVEMVQLANQEIRNQTLNRILWEARKKQ